MAVVGFTGLSAALTLARDYGVRAVVLTARSGAAPAATAARARTPREGCTARSGSSAGAGHGRRLDAEIREGFEYWKSLVAQVDCDAQPGGHLYTAHRQKKMAFLENESRVMREVFGYDTRMLSRPARALRGRPRGRGRCWSRTAWACIRSSWPTATCARRARWARASIRPAGAGWRAERRLPVADPGGTVRARVAFATGGSQGRA